MRALPALTIAVADTGQRSEKLLGKRRERASPTISNPQTQEEDSLTDRDADWEPEDVEVGIPSTPGSASKFVRLASEPDDRSQHSQNSPDPSPGSSTSRGARGITFLRRRQPPRTRASGRESPPSEYESLPNEAPHFTCNWVPLQSPEQRPCQETCTRLSDLRRHQRPHFEMDLNYAKQSRDEEAVAKAQVAIDKCAGRGQSYSCEVCGRVYSRFDAVARHRQQPQGRQCNIIYKQRRAKERARAKESQEAETEAEAEAEAEEVEGSDKEKDIEVQPKLEEGAQEVQREEEDEQAGKEENKE
ncbi:hypothetical protein RSOLAG1IB_06632 [Rhizoctonia solani AG-1 IB]|uniref:C2H2-type domain-containing protein n=1 Tax=Thanatephorus cucumeris (strain AG1-IB / isolate 7/3/14) TaxID=1108050 RepID=A0A0B7F708_THACB|nr:hypothetical protein RSOLAG1IB_06632 [Rhizoctonia solani AG-1 IB]